jgi:hypothetical protein
MSSRYTQEMAGIMLAHDAGRSAHRTTDGGERRVIQIKLRERQYGALVEQARKRGRTPTQWADELFQAAWTARQGPTGDQALDAAVARIGGPTLALADADARESALRAGQAAIAELSGRLNGAEEARRAVEAARTSLAEELRRCRLVCAQQAETHEAESAAWRAKAEALEARIAQAAAVVEPPAAEPPQAEPPQAERGGSPKPLSKADARRIRTWSAFGMTDAAIAAALNCTEADVTAARQGART